MLSNIGYPLPDWHVVIVVTVRMIVEIGSVRCKFIKFYNFYWELNNGKLHCGKLHL